MLHKVPGKMCAPVRLSRRVLTWQHWPESQFIISQSTSAWHPDKQKCGPLSRRK